MAKRITIADVARTAGVSIATVSRVLNNHPTVNTEMVTRVRAAAQALGYQPSPVAQGLATGAYRTIGVVVPDLGNPYFTDILSGIVSAATPHGFRTVVADSRGDADEELSACLSYGSYVDGMILVSSRLEAGQLQGLAAVHKAVVLVNREEPEVDLPTALADTRSATVQLSRHLADLGHRRVSYIAGPATSWQNQERLLGLQDATRFGIVATVVPGEGSIDAAYNATESALRSDPTAIMAFNDLSAIGVMTRLAELGLQVPDQISVTGFDDIEVARYLRPRLTTVISPKAQLGELAWRALRARFTGSEPLEYGRVESAVVIRESTGPAAR